MIPDAMKAYRLTFENSKKVPDTEEYIGFLELKIRTEGAIMTAIHSGNYAVDVDTKGCCQESISSFKTYIESKGYACCDSEFGPYFVQIGWAHLQR